MGFRFRRSFKLGPLGRVNLGKKGASLSLGVKGAHVNFGSRGTRVTVGVPGTGVSYTSRVGGAQLKPSSTSSSAGCLKVFLALVLIVPIGAFLVGVFQANPYVASALVLLVVGVWLWVARVIKRGRAARAQAVLDEQQRRYAADQAEQLRLAEAQQAEHERQRRERWTHLVAQFGEANANRIWAGRPWIGCTVPMLLETLGHPADIDEKVLKTKTKHTYKYNPAGGNRYGLRIYIENDEVTGWEDKSD
jgi:Protein of unknown function (DUF4236)